MSDTSDEYEPFRAAFVAATNALKPHISDLKTEYLESERRGWVSGRMIDGRSLSVGIVIVPSTVWVNEITGEGRS